MTETPNIWNTGLPLLILGALGWLVPRTFVSTDTRSHGSVAVAVVASAIALVAISALVLVAFDTLAYQSAMAVGGAFLVAEIALRGSVLFAIAWGPMLLLSWFNLAQRVEVQRGKDMAKGNMP
ncbi:hypothetical protein [Tateyamaria sp.]|uniref:hypothetical protein n=1 Tax=Tateyamaria sp. TaxID=1929288 RepID=UPI0032689AA8